MGRPALYISDCHYIINREKIKKGGEFREEDVDVFREEWENGSGLATPPFFWLLNFAFVVVFLLFGLLRGEILVAPL